MRRLEGEKVTVADIFGGENDWVGGAKAEEEEEETDGDLGFGAKNREITCCFCFPMKFALQNFVSVLTHTDAFTQTRWPPLWRAFSFSTESRFALQTLHLLHLNHS